MLHLGHIRHLRAAKHLGFFLYVSVAPDAICRLKGPHRPYFPEQERAEAISALDCVDHVEVSDSLDAIIKHQPEVYVKGPECRENQSPRLQEEIRLVREFGGRVVYTEDSIYSSTELMTRLLQTLGI
jgi:cytidyltransferase-like protein